MIQAYIFCYLHIFHSQNKIGDKQHLIFWTSLFYLFSYLCPLGIEPSVLNSFKLAGCSALNFDTLRWLPPVISPVWREHLSHISTGGGWSDCTGKTILGGTKVKKDLGPLGFHYFSPIYSSMSKWGIVRVIGTKNEWTTTKYKQK